MEIPLFGRRLDIQVRTIQTEKAKKEPSTTGVIPWIHALLDDIRRNPTHYIAADILQPEKWRNDFEAD